MFNSPTEGFPWDDLRKIFIERSWMAKVPNGVEALPKISITWVGSTNVTDDRQTDRRQTTAVRQTDVRWHICEHELEFTFAKNCDPLVTHGPYLSAVAVVLPIIMHYSNHQITYLLNYFTMFVCVICVISMLVSLAYQIVIYLHVCICATVNEFIIIVKRLLMTAATVLGSAEAPLELYC